jgi:hypothetical protein
MTYRKDNIDIQLPLIFGMNGESTIMLKMFETWLKENNVKYTRVYKPEWSNSPYALNMRNEDATAFKLRFGL